MSRSVRRVESQFAGQAADASGHKISRLWVWKMARYSDVAGMLTAEIFAGRLKPGEKLVVSELASRFGTSSMPIRFAIQELKGQGLVTGEPNHGVRVRAVNAEYIDNSFDVRLALLGLIYPRVVHYITNADIELLAGIQDEMDECARIGDFECVRACNARYHRKIHECARNPEAAHAISRNWVLIDSLRAQHGYSDERLANMSNAHRAIIEALRRRDAEAAFAIQRESSEKARVELIGFLTGPAQRS